MDNAELPAKKMYLLTFFILNKFLGTYIKVILSIQYIYI